MNRTILLGAVAGLTLLATTAQAQPPGRGFGGPPPFMNADANNDGAISAAEWSALFATLDADHNGRLEGSELPAGPPHGPGALAYMLSHEADANSDGKVSLAEYKARIAKLDRDGDGALSPSELPFRPRGGAADGNPPPFVTDADSDNDGKLSVDELVAVFNTADEDHDGVLSVRGPHGPHGRR